MLSKIRQLFSYYIRSLKTTLWHIGSIKNCPWCNGKLEEVGHPKDCGWQDYLCINTSCDFGKRNSKQ